MPGRGFTLVEVMISLVLLATGLLATAAALGTAARMIAEGRRASLAATLAAARLEVIRGEACPVPGSGARHHGTAVVSWSVMAVPRGRRIVVAVSTPGPFGQNVDAFATLIACPG
jgi:prepilin-type N-terminal cleavage/methylation domain-containing protein